MSDQYKNNFKTAFGELFTADKKANPEPTTPSKDTNKATPKNTGADSLLQVKSKASEKSAFSPIVKQDLAIGTTVITSDTVITGSISSKSNLEILGSVAGDIDGEHNVVISGKVEGNIACKSASIQAGAVKGNILCKETISLNELAVILGNLEAENIISNAKIKGDIKASGSITLKSNAILLGNLSAKNLVMEDGSVINGSVEIINEASTKNSNFSF